MGKLISDLPANTGLVGTELIEIQKGTGVGASQSVTINALVTFVPTPIASQIKYSPLVLTPPVINSVTTAATGGTLAAATYYYKVTALNANGETIGSNELLVTTTGTTSANTVAWAAVTGATSYKVYRGTAAGTESAYYAPGNVVSYVDTGAANTAGTVPTTNTATTGNLTGTNVQTALQQADSAISTTAATAAAATASALATAEAYTNTQLAALTTTNVPEGTNKYYTAQRNAQSAVTALTNNAGTVNVNLALGSFFTLLLGANVTVLTFTNLPVAGAGQTIAIRIQQDATGSRTLALPASFHPTTGSATAIAFAPNTYTLLMITSFDQGTRWEYSMQPMVN